MQQYCLVFPFFPSQKQLQHQLLDLFDHICKNVRFVTKFLLSSLSDEKKPHAVSLCAQQKDLFSCAQWH